MDQMSCTALCFVFLNANINVVVQYRIHSLNFIFVWFCDSTIFLMIFKEGDQTFELLTKLNNSIISLHINFFIRNCQKIRMVIYIYIYIFFFFSYSYLELATLVTNSNSVAWTLQREHSGVFHRNRIQLLTLSTLASVCIFSILFPIHSLRC